MKVCFIANTEYLGATSTAYYEYTQTLAQMGVKVFVISAILQQKTKIIKKINHNGVEVYMIPVKTLAKKDFITATNFGYRAIELAREIYEKERYDILQIRAFPNLGFCLVPLWLRNKCKLILDIRSTAISNKLMNLLSRLVINLQNRFYDYIIILDEEMLNLLSLDKNKVTVIPLGANLKRFYSMFDNPQGRKKKRQEFGFPVNKTICIYCGSLMKTRRLEEIIYAFKYVLSKCEDVHLIFLGDGPKDYVNYLKNLSNDLKISRNITFIGEVPFKEVPHYLAVADIGISFIPNIDQYRYQPPLKTAEYLAAGLAVVATDTFGNRRFIKNMVNGILVQDNRDSLANGLIKVIRDEVFQYRLMQMARISVKDFDYNVIVKNRLIPYYRRVIEGL